MEIYTSIDIIKDEFNKEMLENRTDNYKVSPIDGIELLEALKNLINISCNRMVLFQCLLIKKKKFLYYFPEKK